jgi:hypothetical protein
MPELPSFPPKIVCRYFIGTETNEAVRIGTTMDLAKDMKEMKEASSIPLILLGVTSANLNDLHKFFKEDRLHGQWFERKAAMNSMLYYLKRNGDLPPASEWQVIIQ